MNLFASSGEDVLFGNDEEVFTFGKVVEIEADDFSDQALEAVTLDRKGGEFFTNQKGKTGPAGIRGVSASLRGSG